MLRRLYDWTMAKASHPRAEWWLALFAFVEASFFPIPPHPLLGLMCLAEPKKAVRFAAITVIASVIGAFYYLRIVYYMYFGAETEGVVSRMGAVQYLGLIVPALIMLVGAVNMFGVDAAAGRAAETLVSNEATPAPAEAAILPAEPERLE
mgnify:CR=1 FL=1